MEEADARHEVRKMLERARPNSSWQAPAHSASRGECSDEEPCPAEDDVPAVDPFGRSSRMWSMLDRLEQEEKEDAAKAAARSRMRDADIVTAAMGNAELNAWSKHLRADFAKKFGLDSEEVEASSSGSHRFPDGADDTSSGGRYGAEGREEQLREGGGFAGGWVGRGSEPVARSQVDNDSSDFHTGLNCVFRTKEQEMERQARKTHAREQQRLRQHTRWLSHDRMADPDDPVNEIASCFGEMQDAARKRTARHDGAHRTEGQTRLTRYQRATDDLKKFTRFAQQEARKPKPASADCVRPGVDAKEQGSHARHHDVYGDNGLDSGGGVVATDDSEAGEGGLSLRRSRWGTAAQPSRATAAHEAGGSSNEILVSDKACATRVDPGGGGLAGAGRPGQHQGPARTIQHHRQHEQHKQRVRKHPAAAVVREKRKGAQSHASDKWADDKKAGRVWLRVKRRACDEPLPELIVETPPRKRRYNGASDADGDLAQGQPKLLRYTLMKSQSPLPPVGTPREDAHGQSAPVSVEASCNAAGQHERAEQAAAPGASEVWSLAVSAAATVSRDVAAHWQSVVQTDGYGTPHAVGGQTQSGGERGEEAGLAGGDRSPARPRPPDARVVDLEMYRDGKSGAAAAKLRRIAPEDKQARVDAMARFRRSLAAELPVHHPDARGANCSNSSSFCNANSSLPDGCGVYDRTRMPVPPLPEVLCGDLGATALYVPDACWGSETKPGHEVADLEGAMDDSAEYAYDWYAVGAQALANGDGEAVGLGPRESDWQGSATPRISLLDYADLLASEDEEEEEVLDEEYDSNAEISDYPFTDPDSVGSHSCDFGAERGERVHTSSDSKVRLNDDGSLHLWKDPFLPDAFAKSTGAVNLHAGEDWEDEGEEDASVNWFAVSSGAEDEPTVIDEMGWHRQVEG